MPVIPPISWSEVAAQCGTGDLIAFTGTDSGSEIIEGVLGGPYSHVVMLLRPDPKQAPLMWQEATESPAFDPVRKIGPHPGAQAADALTVLKIMTGEGMVPSYIRLDWTRTPDFETKVSAAVQELDTTPFGTYETMAADFAMGRTLNMDSGREHMFCSQLVAVTLQMGGLLGSEHPPNWYSPSSFAGESTDVVLLQGAKYDFEQPIAVPLV